jgi:hypothetical protein
MLIVVIDKTAAATLRDNPKTTIKRSECSCPAKKLFVLYINNISNSFPIHNQLFFS